MLNRRRSVIAWPLVGMICLMASAQLLFKQAGLHASAHTGWLESLALNAWLWTGMAVSAVGMVCWLLTLRRLPLATAYPWTALIYVMTPLASKLLFDDQLSWRYLSGMSLIVLGVVFIASSTRMP